jgi:hypothetical protein
MPTALPPDRMKTATWRRAKRWTNRKRTSGRKIDPESSGTP